MFNLSNNKHFLLHIKNGRPTGAPRNRLATSSSGFNRLREGSFQFLAEKLVLDFFDFSPIPFTSLELSLLCFFPELNCLNCCHDFFSFFLICRCNLLTTNIIAHFLSYVKFFTVDVILHTSRIIVVPGLILPVSLHFELFSDSSIL